MKELDEVGIPLPLAERLAEYVGDASGRTEAVEKLRRAVPQIRPQLDGVDGFILDLALSVN